MENIPAVALSLAVLASRSCRCLVSSRLKERVRYSMGMAKAGLLLRPPRPLRADEMEEFVGARVKESPITGVIGLIGLNGPSRASSSSA